MIQIQFNNSKSKTWRLFDESRAWSWRRNWRHMPTLNVRHWLRKGCIRCSKMPSGLYLCLRSPNKTSAIFYRCPYFVSCTHTHQFVFYYVLSLFKASVTFFSVEHKNIRKTHNKYIKKLSLLFRRGTGFTTFDTDLRIKTRGVVFIY